MATQQAAAVGVRRIPRVREAPLVGSMFAAGRDRLAFFTRVARDYGDIAEFHFGPARDVFINSAELLQSWLVEHAHDYDKSWFQRNAFGPVVGQGLFTSEGDLHRTQRKLMAPLFTPRRVASYADTMVAYADRAQAGWREGDTVDLAGEMTGLTMRIVGKALLNAEVSGETDELGAAITGGLQWVEYAFTHLFPVPLWVPTARSRRTRRAIAVLRRRLRAIIAERRADGEDRGDLLSLLLQARDEAGRGMSDEQLYDEVVTMFGAGHETTAVALTWSFYLLSRHPECRDRLEREVDGALAGRPPTYADLPRLPYTLQVFKEALRLYPPASGLARAALRDTELCGYPIPKGTAVLASQYVLHRRPDYFLDPERFDPDRFTPEREQQLPRYAYIPFGGGHRTCIGNHFALMEGQLVLATLAQRVRFEPVPGQQVAPQRVVTLRPRGGVKMRVRRRAAGTG